MRLDLVQMLASTAYKVLVREFEAVGVEPGKPVVAQLLRCVAVWFGVLQCGAVCCSVSAALVAPIAVCCGVL